MSFVGAGVQGWSSVFPGSRFHRQVNLAAGGGIRTVNWASAVVGEFVGFLCVANRGAI